MGYCSFLYSGNTILKNDDYFSTGISSIRGTEHSRTKRDSSEMQNNSFSKPAAEKHRKSADFKEVYTRLNTGTYSDLEVLREIFAQLLRPDHGYFCGRI